MYMKFFMLLDVRKIDLKFLNGNFELYKIN